MDRCIRRHPLDGLKNARDLGGFPAMDGRVTKYGVFIRSELPRRLSASDLDYLRKLGVCLSVDFRGGHECETYPSAMRDVDFAEYRWEPIFDERAALAGLKNSKPQDFREVSWSYVYVEMAENGKAWARRVLEALAACGGAAMFNCTTGKDRTGLCTALLLGLAGVEDSDIIADYCVSEVYMRSVYLELGSMLPVDCSSGEPDLNAPFFRTEHGNMRALLEHLKYRYGGIEGYAGDAGVSRGTISRLRAKLLGE